MKRDYISLISKPNGLTAVKNLAATFEHYNEWHPHSAPGYRSPREYLRRRTYNEITSGQQKLFALLEFSQYNRSDSLAVKPQQNAYMKRYNRIVCCDWLVQHMFSSLDELLGYTTRWQWFYNHERPNMALNGYTPMQRIC